MGSYLEKLHNKMGNMGIDLTWFDFHAQCKNMKYENLAKLLDSISKDI